MTSSDDVGTGGGGRRARLDLSGVYPPIATPFDDNENVDYDRLGFNLQRWNDIPFKGTYYSSRTLRAGFSWCLVGSHVAQLTWGH